MTEHLSYYTEKNIIKNKHMQNFKVECITHMDAEFCCNELNVHYLWLRYYLKEIEKLKQENEQLKQAYNKLKCYHSNLYDEFHDIECNKDRYYKDVLSLEKENELLTSKIQLLVPLLDLADAIIDLGDDDNAKSYWEKRSEQAERKWKKLIEGGV